MPRPKDNTFVSAEGLTKIYKGQRVPAVNDITFKIGRGELVSLIGDNGVGKSTLIEMIVCQKKRTYGSLKVFGLDTEKHASRIVHRIGYLPQSASLYDKLTVRENLNHFAAMHVYPADISNLISTFGLSEIATSRYEHLSGGQKQRACLACALTGNPELIVLDEPATGFDPSMREEIWGALSRLRDSGKTVILSTHNISEAMLYSDRIMYMDRGKLIYDGNTDGLISDLKMTIHDPNHVLDGYDKITNINGSLIEIDVADPNELPAIIQEVMSRGITSGSIKFSGGEHVRIRGAPWTD